MISECQLKNMLITQDSVKVLDQTLLPHTVHFIDINTITDAWTVIKEMKTRGAPLIAVVALQGLKVELLRNLEKLQESEAIHKFVSLQAEYLKTSRPTAVNLANDLDNLIVHIKEIIERESLVKEILNYIDQNLVQYEKCSFDIARHGADLILNKFKNKKKISVLTICNTGKLAMPGVGTALGIIRELNNRNKLETLYIPETRPYNQGARLTAFEALKDNLPGVLITDSMAGMLMKNKKVDCIIVGADRITKLGYTANKIGTYSFAVLAKHHNIPLYVAAPESTIDKNMTYGYEIVIEERPADELRKINDTYISPKDIPVFNPSFDVTPPNLIEDIITEKGAYEYDRNGEEWEELKEQKLEKYLKENGNFRKDEKITFKDVADGNLNYVYFVQGEGDNTICAKQALPWVKCVGTSWPLSLKRTLFEAEALKYYSQVCKEFVPEFIHYDEDKSLLLMEFLNDYTILRGGLISGNKYANLGKDLGLFVARSTFFSSDLHIPAEELREKISFWNANTLCTLTEQVVFKDPYYNAPLNRTGTDYLDLTSLRTDKEVIKSVFNLRHKFINQKQALIHGDLHTGSIMVNNSGSCKVIDPEFAFYGPIAYDLGNVIAHLLVPIITQSVDKQWVIGEMKSFWNTFEQEFRRLWNVKENRVEEFPSVFETNVDILEEIQSAYMREVFRDTLGYAGTEIIRRIVGVAYIADFGGIVDEEQRKVKENKAMEVAVGLLKGVDGLKNIDDLVNYLFKI